MQRPARAKRTPPRLRCIRQDHDTELEKEAGEVGCAISVDIKRRGVTREVGVDARTGKVLGNRNEGKTPTNALFETFR